MFFLTVTNAAVRVCGATATGFMLMAVWINWASLMRDATKAFVAVFPGLLSVR